MPQLVDTHAHLNFSEYDRDRDEVIKDSLEQGIFVINVGTNYFSSELAVKIAQGCPQGLYAAIGLHPENIQYDPEAAKSKSDKPENIAEFDFDADKYAKLAESPKVVAVGEIGLDYFNFPKSAQKTATIKEKQKEIFLKQLNFARDHGLPIIIHCRNAHDEIIETLKQQGKVKGVVHCFTANIGQMEQYRDLGFYFGLNGILFKARPETIEAVKAMPRDRILLETDCPYLSPPPPLMAGASLAEGGPLPKTDRNVPQNVKIIAEHVAQIRGENTGAIIVASTASAKKIFKIS